MFRLQNDVISINKDVFNVSYNFSTSYCEHSMWYVSLNATFRENHSLKSEVKDLQQETNHFFLPDLRSLPNAENRKPDFSHKKRRVSFSASESGSTDETDVDAEAER